MHPEFESGDFYLHRQTACRDKSKSSKDRMIAARSRISGILGRGATQTLFAFVNVAMPKKDVGTLVFMREDGLTFCRNMDDLPLSASEQEATKKHSQGEGQ